MLHEPSRLIGDAERSMELVSAKALLARSHEMDCEPPLRKWNLGTLKDRSDCHRELLLAGTAPVETWASGLALNLADLVERTTMRTDGAMRPHQRLDCLAGDVVVSEGGGLKIGGGHERLPNA